MPGMFEDIIVVTGHYGSGKTNLSLNLAMEFAARGESVALADLDVVNPYFRTADFGDMARKNGIELLASDYAGSTLDIPAVSGALDAKINGGGALIIDVGGDDAGATALGRYAPEISQKPYTMIYVVNRYRYLMREPRDAFALLKQIEAASRLRATHVANCSNLGAATTAEDILSSVEYAREVARLANLPLVFTAAKRELAPKLGNIREIFPVEIYVRPPWIQGT